MEQRRSKKTHPRVALIGVPMDLGSDLRGVDMGPSAIRIAGVVKRLRRLGCRIEDQGNLSVPHAFVAGKGSSKVKFAEPIETALKTLTTTVEEVLKDGLSPLVLGGDHSIAIGTLAGLTRFGRGDGRKARTFGLLWVDAHGDLNTPETTPSGNVHGMPLAAALGMGEERFIRLAGDPPMIDPSQAVLLAVRELDRGERKNIRSAGLHVITMREIDERGVYDAVKEALAIVTTGTDGFHLSVDMDCLDPRFAPGVGTPVAGGLTVREAHLIMEMVADTRHMVSAEFVEVNPVLDQRNMTAELAAGLIYSAFGGTIL